MNSSRTVIVGAGSAGLSAAIRLASSGREVVLLERGERAGGKMRSCSRADFDIDAGPTVMTMPWVFEELLAPLGHTLSGLLEMRPLETLARHFWDDGSQLDLHADRARTDSALRAFAGEAAVRQYDCFARSSAGIYRLLEGRFLAEQQAGLAGLLRRTPAVEWPALARLKPFTSLWRAMGSAFTDPRLRQLFSRYSTYCGSSPMCAPATLMLIAHVESLGVFRIRGGMRALAAALARCAADAGTRILYGREVVEIESHQGRVTGVRTATNERFAADSVIVNGDTNALASGLFGHPASASISPTSPGRRSLSAVTFAGLLPGPQPALSYHNVFFSSDYPAEFRQLAHGRLPDEPTIYVCAPDSGTDRAQRLFLLVNAPADGDRSAYDRKTIGLVTDCVARRLAACGLDIMGAREFEVTTPADYHGRYPATGGALYGPAMHGWRAAFLRPPSRTRMPGLYVAGGSVHPGSGVPMAARSGMLAADAVIADDARNRGRHPGGNAR